MADTTEKKTYLVNVESNLNKYAQDAANAATEVEKLEAENKALLKSSTASKEEIEKSNSALRNAKKEYTDAKKLVDLQTQANNSNINSRKQLQAIVTLEQRRLGALAETYTINSKGVRELSQDYIIQVKRLKEAKDAVIAYDKAQSDGRSSVGLYSEAIQKSLGDMQMMPGILGQAAGGITRMTSAAKMFIATPIGAIIAALAAVIGVLTSYFKRSEEGQNAFTKVTKILGSVIENILDIVGKVGKALFEAFTKPKEAIKAIGEFIQSQITNRIQALKDIGGAVVKIFSKDWKQGFKELGESTVQLVTGVDDLVGKVGRAGKAFIDELSADAKKAAELADQMAALHKREREEVVEDARIQKEVAKLRADAEKLKLTNAEESIRLMKLAFDKEQKILKDELEIAITKRDNAKESAALADTNIETLDEIARLEGDVFLKQAAFDEKRRQTQKSMNRLRKEAFNQEKEQLTALLEIEKSQVDAQISNNEKIIKNDLYTYDERLKALKENQQLKTDILLKQAELEVKEVDKDYELETISLENANIKRMAIAEKYKSDTLKIASDTADEQKKIMDDLLKHENDRKAIDAKNKIDIQESQNRYEFDLQRQKLENEYTQEIFAAQKTGADVLLINQKFAAAKQKIDEAELKARLGLYADFFGNLATLFGEGTAIGKAAAIAQTTIATYTAAMEAYKSLVGIPYVGPVLAVAAAAAAVATGIANIKKILAVKSGLPGESGGSAPTAISSQFVKGPSPQANIFTLPTINQGQLNALPNQNPLTAKDIAAEIAKLPAPRVSVEDINARMTQKKKVEVRANI